MQINLSHIGKNWKKTANLPLDEDTTEVFVATGCGGMEGCPKLVVCRIYIGFVLQQEGAHVQAVVDAALKEMYRIKQTRNLATSECWYHTQAIHEALTAALDSPRSSQQLNK